MPADRSIKIFLCALTAAGAWCFFAEAFAAQEITASPKFLLLVNESSLPNAAAKQWWTDKPYSKFGVAQTALSAELKQKMFEVLDPSADKLPPLPDDLRKKTKDMAIEDVAQIGRAVGADFVVVGDSNLKLIGPAPGGAAMQVEASISVKVLSIDSKSWIAAGEKKETAAYPLLDYACAYAMQRAAKKLGKNLGDALALQPEIRALQKKKK